MIIFKRKERDNCLDRCQYLSMVKMGNQQSKPVEYQKQELRSTHPWQQKSWLVWQEGKNYIQSSYPIGQKHYEYWRRNVQKTAGSQMKDFLFLPEGMGFVPNENDKDGYVVVNFPPFFVNLEDEINRRKHENAYFKEKQLYYLMYALVAAKINAHARGEVVGDIRPQNVFINQDEKVKIACLHSFPYEKSNYAKYTDALKPSYDVVLAPEDLKSATQRQLDNTKNQHSETFSIGATILSAGILQDIRQSYDYPNKAFKQSVHTSLTTQLVDHPHYSQIFKSIVLSLLNPIPQRRISLQQLWRFLFKYQDSILAKEQFIVTHPPVLFQSGVSLIRSKVQ